ncbi:hypothetical protein SJAV_17490 [Sulfurisphaera javensis]|uniref:Uncharacterized protein n=1 Tax=Sulfurisphaera javensis TaxID=2049879 RepID=A0AAT9GSL3_9CREN
MYVTILPVETVLVDSIYESGDYYLVKLGNYYGVTKDNYITYMTENKLIALLTLYEMGLVKPRKIKEVKELVLLRLSHDDIFNNGDIVLRKKGNKEYDVISLDNLKEENLLIYDWKFNAVVLNDEEKHLTYMLTFDRCYEREEYKEAKVYECYNQFGRFYVLVDIVDCVVSQSLTVLNKISELVFNINFLK